MNVGAREQSLCAQHLKSQKLSLRHEGAQTPSEYKFKLESDCPHRRNFCCIAASEGFGSNFVLSERVGQGPLNTLFKIGDIDGALAQ